MTGLTVIMRIALGFGIGSITGFASGLLAFITSKALQKSRNGGIIIMNWTLMGAITGLISGASITTKIDQPIFNCIIFGIMIGAIIGFSIGVILKCPIHECGFHHGFVIGSIVGILISCMSIKIDQNPDINIILNNTFSATRCWGQLCITM